MKVLGLDISSQTVGWAIIDKSLKLLDYGFIKPKKSEFCLEERIDSVVSFISDIYKKHKPEQIVIEEITQHMEGGSNAQTILILAAFNRIISYFLYKSSGIIPTKLMPATIRAEIRKFLNKKGRLSKDDIYDVVVDFFPNFKPYITEKGKNKGMQRKENFDIADAIAAAWAWIIQDGIE